MKTYYRCPICDAMETREESNLNLVCPNCADPTSGEFMGEVEPETDRELHDRYDESLDESHPDLTIAGLSYSTSHALKAVDPTAYRCGFNDWLDAETSDGIYFEHDGETFKK